MRIIILSLLLIVGLSDHVISQSERTSRRMILSPSTNSTLFNSLLSDSIPLDLKASSMSLLSLDSLFLDTILVEVICHFHAPGTALFQPLRMNELRLERTLHTELVTLPSTPWLSPDGSWNMTLEYRQELKSVVIATRWLDETTGCYRLFPLDD